MDITEALDGVLKKKLEIKHAMLVFENDLRMLQNELHWLAPEATLNRLKQSTDLDIEAEPIALRRTLYLLKEISDSLSFIEYAKCSNPQLYPDIDISSQQSHYTFIKEAVYEIMSKTDIPKINYTKKLKNLAEMLLKLETDGDIEHVSPRVVAAHFLVSNREVNQRSYSSALSEINKEKQAGAEKVNGPLINTKEHKY